MERSSIDLDLLGRIFSKLDHYPESTDKCWIWHGARSCGTPMVGFGGKKTRRVRIVLLEIFAGVHNWRTNNMRCHNHACVNPWHIDPLVDTQARWESAHRKGSIAWKILRQVCKNGHPKVGNNRVVKRYANGYTAIVCRICRYTYFQDYYGHSYAKAIEELKAELGYHDEAQPSVAVDAGNATRAAQLARLSCWVAA